MQTDLAAHRAELTPDRPAVQFRGRWYRYTELNRRAEQLAARLREAGVRAGDRVGLLAANHIAHVDLLLAAPKLGHVSVPFNYRLPPAEQRGLGEYIAPTLLLHDSTHLVQARATGAPLRCLDDYESWLESAPEFTGGHTASAEDPAMILFTGGSTGLPKGALIPYRQLHANAVNTCQSWEVGEADCAIQATPAFHAAFNVFTTPLLQAGGRVIQMEAFAPAEYLATVTREKVSVLFLVPTMYQMLAEHPSFATADLSSVRWAISGGAACPEPLRERYERRGIRFKQGYGMTEAGVNCFAVTLDEAQRRPGTVGTPIANAEAVIRAEDGTPVARGEIGELTLRGPHLCLGYYRRPEETAKAFRDGWLWTGDLARQDADGYYYIVGRSKEMYISGGENVYPVEVEAALYEQPEIAECAVLGVADELWGDVGLAAIACKSGHTVTGADLRLRLKQRLAGYKVPTHYLFLEALPKSGAGKIHKPEIRKLFEQGPPS